MFFTMSDGIRLYTQIIKPENLDKCPCVFIRTPYERDEQSLVATFLSRGFAAIIQHTRGRGKSEGQCIPYRERDDGLCSLEHIRKLPFYNGEIYLYGQSYCGSAHLSYLNPVPEDIKAICIITAADNMYCRYYKGGCNYSFSNLDWWLMMLGRKKEGTPKKPYKEILMDVPEYTKTLFSDRLLNDDLIPAVAENLNIPVLFVEGWMDYYLEGMLSMWCRLPDKTRKSSSMIIGPWGHASKTDEHTNYPMKNSEIPEDFGAVWFDSIRKSAVFPYCEKGKIKYYTIGGDKWLTEKFSEDAERLYFNKRALSVSEQLSGKSSYTYNPEERLDFFYYHTIRRSKPVDICRGKLLSFESQEAEEEKGYCGKIKLHINVSTDCEDTAFFARIYLVENGEAYNLTESITALSELHPDYTPNERVSIDLVTPPIAFTLKKGAKIRIIIASDGTVYVPHANVKGQWAEVTQTKIARNTLYFENSYVELPIEKSPHRGSAPKDSNERLNN